MSAVAAQARTVRENLQLAHAKVRLARSFASRPSPADIKTVRDLAQTAIFALEDVLKALPEEDARELRRDPEATLALAERDV